MNTTFLTDEEINKLSNKISKVLNDEIRKQLSKHKAGVDFISEERNRQIQEEKHTFWEDDKYVHNELPNAAAIYAIGFEKSLQNFYTAEKSTFLAELWPWDLKYYKPAYNKEQRVHELAKAGALIAAEIDRILRQ